MKLFFSMKDLQKEMKTEVIDNEIQEYGKSKAFCYFILISMKEDIHLTVITHGKISSRSFA